MSTTPELWMEEARHLAAQCWCDPETQNIEMDSRLAESCAKRIAGWMDTAAQAYRDAEYYRGLVIQCGENFGRDAYICDDGSVSQDILCAKIPELVSRLASKIE